ncbi:MAG: sulfatase-like hydrolase/transferase [Lautropia sp.]
MSARNILFIMCDQLRHDYLACAGHPTIRTPHIDSLAARGVRFSHAYAQSPICGPSRMSFYTGRYVRSHGVTWNAAPLPVGEWNIGHHLNPLGMRTVLCGKSHMAADVAGMTRLGIDPHGEIGARLSQCGFEAWDRLDGIHPPSLDKKPSHYNQYLNAVGYDGADPIHHWAHHVQGEHGEALSGWLLSNVNRPARVRAEHAETAYTTSRAIAFIEQAGSDRWCLHLSYIKPHWPYVAPAPYHALYGPDDVVPAIRSDAERIDPHPILAAYQRHRVCEVFSRPGVRERVIPAYMGLITQIDDEIGRLLGWLERTGRSDDTLIVFTADHGDYLGDHWLGEKELFHDASVRIPLIVVDPSRDADPTRGTVSDALIESIDLLPTFVEVAGGTVPRHVIEGRSLRPLLHGARPPEPRRFVVSEYDYSPRRARKLLEREIAQCQLQMIFDGRWKMIRAPGYRPMLYDLGSDPDELHDMGNAPEARPVLDALHAELLDWSTMHHNRVTRSDQAIEDYAGSEFQLGIHIGFWDDVDLAQATALDDGGN